MKHVIIVEDHKDHAWLLSSILTRIGFLTTTSLDLFFLLKQVTERKVDVIVLDIRIPNLIPGYEIITQVRAINKTIPIVMVTADPSEDMRIKCLSRGADYYCVKPIVHKDILTVFKQWL